MKIKFVFILSNIIILVFLVFLCTIPSLMAPADFAPAFWRLSWPLVLVLVLFLIALECFYFYNRRLFLLLEREDWPALVQYLEMRVIRKGHYSPHLVRLLANTYLVLSDSAAVINLENKTAIVKPALVETNALIFGAARILGKDIAGAVNFFSTRLDPAPGRAPQKQAQWIRWYYGFALLLDRQFTPAADQFILLAKEADDALVAGLSAFFLYDTLTKIFPERSLELQALAAEGQNRVRGSLPAQRDWDKEAAKIETEVHAAILFKNLGNAARWIYGGIL
ncbi:MAG: hypothetical protein LBT93_05885 [Treponema sp.]|nr:hypothetical protein [Treponema sp.]